MYGCYVQSCWIVLITEAPMSRIGSAASANRPGAGEILTTVSELQSAQTAAAQDLLVLGRVGVVLSADRRTTGGAAVLVLVARRQDEQEVAANRSRRLAGRAEKLGGLEGLVVTIVANGRIFNI